MLGESMCCFASGLYYTSLMVLRKLFQQGLRWAWGKSSLVTFLSAWAFIFLRLGVCLLALGQLPEETND